MHFWASLFILFSFNLDPSKAYGSEKENEEIYETENSKEVEKEPSQIQTYEEEKIDDEDYDDFEEGEYGKAEKPKKLKRDTSIHELGVGITSFNFSEIKTRTDSATSDINFQIKDNRTLGLGFYWIIPAQGESTYRSLDFFLITSTGEAEIEQVEDVTNARSRFSIPLKTKFYELGGRVTYDLEAGAYLGASLSGYLYDLSSERGTENFQMKYKGILLGAHLGMEHRIEESFNIRFEVGTSYSVLPSAEGNFSFGAINSSSDSYEVDGFATFSGQVFITYLFQ